MNQILNAFATGLMMFALAQLTSTLIDRGYRWLAAGVGVWTIGFAIRFAATVSIAATPEGEPIPEWISVAVREWAWTYRGIGAVALLTGVWIMGHQERPTDVLEALEERANGVLVDE